MKVEIADNREEKSCLTFFFSEKESYKAVSWESRKLVMKKRWCIPV